MSEYQAQAGALEKREDAGKGEAGEARLWLMEIELASKQEEQWRKRAKEGIARYRDEKDRRDWQFNILWSNVEVLRPNLYSSTPKPNVQRRFRDADPVGKAASLVLERALECCIDAYDFDAVMENVILDYVLPSRGVARVRFQPSFTTQTGEDGQPYETMAYAAVPIERVPWDRFRRGPGVTWDEVQWLAYEHQLTREEIETKFKGFGDKVNYDVVMEGVSEERANAEPSIFKRVRVWEIWDKARKEVKFLAPTYKEGFLLKEGDKLNLEGFFDCERPLYAVESGTTLVPVVEFDMYRDQAKELDRVTMRINKLINALKVRGIYDATITEMKDLLRADDNDLIPTSTAIAAMQAGGLDKAIWLMPIEQAASVLGVLYEQRERLKQTIYELTGLSDILRGSTDPDETLGAQQLKAQTGSMRMQRRQRDVQRFIRGLLRKKAEIIAENFTPELLALMTGVELPYERDKQAAQQQVAMMQQQAEMQAAQQQAAMAGQPVQPGAQPPPSVQPPPPFEPPPELQAVLASPTWEDVMKVLKSDLLRAFRVDIETDSTIAADQASEREQVTELITGIGGFVQNIGPAVETGALSMEAARKILLSGVRRFKLGRDVEEALENEMNQPPPQRPDPKAGELKIKGEELKIKKMESDTRMQIERDKLDFERVRANDEMQLKRDQMDKDDQFRREAEDAKNGTTKEIERMRGEASSKPTTQIQFDADAAIQDAAKGIQGIAEQAVASNGEQLAMIQQTLAANTQAMQMVAQAIAQQGQDSQVMLAIAQQNAQAVQAVGEGMAQLAQVMGAEREGVFDPSTGKLRGSRVKLQ